MQKCLRTAERQQAMKDVEGVIRECDRGHVSRVKRARASTERPENMVENSRGGMPQVPCCDLGGLGPGSGSDLRQQWGAQPNLQANSVKVWLSPSKSRHGSMHNERWSEVAA